MQDIFLCVVANHSKSDHHDAHVLCWRLLISKSLSGYVILGSCISKLIHVCLHAFCVASYFNRANSLKNSNRMSWCIKNSL